MMNDRYVWPPPQTPTQIKGSKDLSLAGVQGAKPPGLPFRSPHTSPQIMQILHVSNFGTRAKGAFLHSVPPKLSRGLVRAGHSVFDFSVRDVARAESFLGRRRFGAGAANAALTRLAHDMRPDLLLLGHADVIRPETVAALRRALPAMRVVQWSVDPLFEPDNLARVRSKLPVVDATLVSTAGEALGVLRHPGMRLGFLPNPVDFSIERGTAHLRENLPWDVFYACGHPRSPVRSLFGRDWDMDIFIAELMRQVPGARARLAGLQGQPNLAGAAYQQALCECAVGLNVSRRNDTFLYTSDRMAQMAGNGLAVLVDRGTGYDTLFSAGEMGFFGCMDELAALLRTLAADKPARQAMAEAGRARYHALFNETTVARYVVDVAFECHDSTRYEWPTLVA